MRARLHLSIAIVCAMRRFRRDRSGSAAVEMAMIAAPFFMMMFAVIETALVFFATQVLETATQDTARLIMTGQAQMNSMSATDFKTNLCNRVGGLFSNCTGSVDLYVKSFPTFASIAMPDPISGGNYVPQTNWDPGHAGDIVVVRAAYQWPLIVTGLGYNPGNVSGNKRVLLSTAAFKNEPGPF